jgi:di/tricarboxylate transporter
MWTFESVKTNSVVKWVVWALGAIVLSALGNALWEGVLKPALVRTSYGLMSLSSLGMESVRTAIYERIATGSTSRVGVETLGVATFLMITLCMLVVRDFHTDYSDFREYQKRQDGRALAEHQKNPEERRKRLQKLTTMFGGVIYFLGFTTLLLVGMLLVNLSRVSYENAAVVHFQQALTIASPYLTDTDRAMIESKFAQIHSKSEYVAILDGLAKTAKEHGQQVPPFNAW